VLIRGPKWKSNGIRQFRVRRRIVLIRNPQFPCEVGVDETRCAPLQMRRWNEGLCYRLSKLRRRVQASIFLGSLPSPAAPGCP